MRCSCPCFPRGLVADALHVPRIKKLTFDKKYTLAFEQVFAKTIICQTLEIAGAYTRSHNLNSITLDGDKYDRKGSLTGGYHDNKRSRLDAVKSLKTWQTSAEEDAKVLAETKTALTRLDQEATQLLGQIQFVEGKLAHVKEEREPMIAALHRAQEEEASQMTRIVRLQSSLEDLQSSVRSLKTESEAYETELKTKMEQKLSDVEQRQVASLIDEEDELKKSLVDLSKSTSEVGLFLASRCEVLG